MKKLLTLFVALALIASVSAGAIVQVQPFGGSGWAACNPLGNYGGDTNCWVAWEPPCTIDASIDATFTVGASGVTTTMIAIDHLNGISDDDGFEVKDGDTVLCTVPDVATDTETWVVTNCDVNFDGEKILTLHPTTATPWSDCATYGQVAIRAITAAATEVEFEGVCSDNALISGWGVPAIAGGVYGGADYTEFCLVWEPACADTTEMASVQLAFNGGDEVIIVEHLDGMINRDSFDVYVDTTLVGHYPDSGVSSEDWETTNFPVNVAPGVHTVTLEVTDDAWADCASWGQLAIKSITVEPMEPVVPEFGLIAGGLAVIGLIAGAVVLRKRD